MQANLIFTARLINKSWCVGGMGCLQAPRGGRPNDQMPSLSPSTHPPHRYNTWGKGRLGRNIFSIL